MFFRFLIISLFFVSCTISPNTDRTVYDSNKLCRIGYNVHPESIPLKNNTLQFSYMHAFCGMERCLDGPITRIVVTAYPMENENILVSVLKERCFDDVYCDLVRDSVVEPNRRDALVKLIQTIRKAPQVECERTKRNSYEWGFFIRIVDENLSLYNIQESCLLSNFPKDSPFVESQIRTFFEKIPIVKNNMLSLDSTELKRKIPSLPSRIVNVKSAMIEENTIFFPINSMTNFQIKPVDSLEYYRASLNGDSVEYLYHRKNDSKNFFTDRVVDADTQNFLQYRKILNDYSTEVFYVDCPEKPEMMRTIYWTENQIVHQISFGKLDDQTKIFNIEQPLKMWFYSKFQNEHPIKKK